MISNETKEEHTREEIKKFFKLILLLIRSTSRTKYNIANLKSKIDLKKKSYLIDSIFISEAIIINRKKQTSMIFV